MSIFLNFSFLVILNLFVCVVCAGAGYYPGWHSEPAGRWNVLGIILLILAVIAVVADIIFMVKAA